MENHKNIKPTKLNNYNTIYYIISDTHFGSHQNSKSWLDDNLEFFYNQFIPEVKKHKLEQPDKFFKLIHCGDVFDVRYSINLETGTRVKKLFKDLLEPDLFDYITIIGGNHDYYQNYTNDNCSIDLILGELTKSEKYKDKIKLITQTIEIDRDNNFIFIPWIPDDNNSTMEYTINVLGDYFEDLIKNSKDKNSKYLIKIFCHLDIFGKFDINHNHIEPLLNTIRYYINKYNINKYNGKNIIENITILSGHIHGPSKCFKPSKSREIYSDIVNLVNLGSTLYLNFSDMDDHYYYDFIETEKGDQLINRHLNKYSIRFHSINEYGKFKGFLDIINGKTNTIKPKDFIRLYIRPEELKDNLKQIREIKSIYKELEILPFFDITYPNSNDNQNFIPGNVGTGFDINNLINYLPEHLKEIYQSLI